MCGWNYLDLLIVLVSWTDLVQGLTCASSEDACLGEENLSHFRILRIARTVRLLRLIRLMRFFRSLRILIYSIACTMRSLMWTLLLLLTIIYVFAIFFTQAVSGYLEAEDVQDTSNPDTLEELRLYYGNLGKSIFTLFMTISGGVDWHQVCYPLSEVHWLNTVLFIVFVAFVVFAVLNVVTGVFCQTAIESAAHDQDMVTQQLLANKENYVKDLTALFKEIGHGHSKTPTLTFEEFETRFDDEKVQNYFEMLELQPENAMALFKLLDSDGSRVVQIDDFVDGCMRLKGHAKSIDVASVRYEQRRMIRKLNNLQLYVEQKLSGLRQSRVSSLSAVKERRSINSEMSAQELGMASEWSAGQWNAVVPADSLF